MTSATSLLVAALPPGNRLQEPLAACHQNSPAEFNRNFQRIKPVTVKTKASSPPPPPHLPPGLLTSPLRQSSSLLQHWLPKRPVSTGSWAYGEECELRSPSDAPHQASGEGDEVGVAAAASNVVVVGALAGVANVI